jgi:hypothetical protein
MKVLHYSLVLSGLLGTLGVLPVLPASAQNKPPLKPVSSQEMNSYMNIASINVCTLLSEKVDFKIAMRSNIRSFGGWISVAHGGAIQSINDSKKIDDKDLANVVGSDLALGVYQRCESLVPPGDAKQIQALIKRIESGKPESAPSNAGGK